MTLYSTPLLLTEVLVDEDSQRSLGQPLVNSCLLPLYHAVDAHSTLPKSWEN